MDLTEKPDLGQHEPNQYFNLENVGFDLNKHMLYSVISGSKAYGLSTPTSDTDLRGVVMPPEKYLLGLKDFEQVDNQSKDVCFYGLRKFFELARKNNVHALEMLWMPDRTVNFTHPSFQQVLSNKELFMSKVLGYSCGGYAFQQVKLMFTKKANNSGRQDLIEQHGFDTKMAGHALRILRMGREALNTGIMTVYRPDREDIFKIKNGGYKLHELAVLGRNESGQEVVASGLLAEEFVLFNEALQNSTLPEKPNSEEIEKLLISMHKQLLGVFD